MIRVSQSASIEVSNSLSATLKSWLPILRVNLVDLDNELKKFNTRDGKGLELLRNNGIKTAIITSENTKIVQRRAEKLKVDYLYQGIQDKLAIVKEICEKEQISLENVAYIGDDINDAKVMQEVGLSACPSDSVKSIKKIADVILIRKGGDACVREFNDEYILLTE